MRRLNLQLYFYNIFNKGTTWVEEIVWLIKNKLNYEKAKKDFHFVRIPWIDQGMSQFTFNKIRSPRIFKSHLPIKFFPENFHKTAKVILC